ncbi:MAG: transporter substrate-binding domain-containing protein, partial [Eubacterium aggregans]
MKKKVFSLSVLLILIALFTFAGYGGGNKTQSTDPLEDGVLKIGSNDTYVPLEYRDEENKIVGFDIDLGDAIAKELGVKSEWVSTAWDGIFTGL